MPASRSRVCADEKQAFAAEKAAEALELAVNLHIFGAGQEGAGLDEQVAARLQVKGSDVPRRRRGQADPATAALGGEGVHKEGFAANHPADATEQAAAAGAGFHCYALLGHHCPRFRLDGFPGRQVEGQQ